MISPNGKLMAFADSYINTTINIIDLERGSIINKIQDNQANLNPLNIRWISNSEIIYSTSSPNTLVIYNIENNAERRNQLNEYIQSITHLYADQFVIYQTIGGKYQMALYDFSTNTVSRSLEANYSPNSSSTVIDGGNSIIDIVPDRTITSNQKWGIRKVDPFAMIVTDATTSRFFSRPNTFYRDGNNLIAITPTSIDTIINGTRGTLSATEIIRIDEKLNIIGTHLIWGRYNYFGFNAYGNIYLKQDYTDKMYVYDQTNSIFIDSLDQFQDDFLFSKNDKIFSVWLGQVHVRDKYLNSENKFDIFDGNLPNSLISGIANLNQNSFLIGTRFGDVKRFDNETGAFIEDYLVTGKWIRDIDISPNKRYLAVGTINSIDIYDGKSLFESIPMSSVIDVDFSNDGKYLSVTCYDDDLLIYDLESRSIRNRFSVGTWIRTAEILDENRIAVGFGREVFVYDINSGDTLHRARPHQGGGNSIEELQLSPDGKKLAIGSGGDHLVIWNPDNYNTLLSIHENAFVQNGTSYYNKCAWNADSRHLYVSLYRHHGYIDTENGAIIFGSQNISQNQGFRNYESVTDVHILEGSGKLLIATEDARMAAIDNDFAVISVEEKNQAELLYPNPANSYINMPETYIGLPYTIINSSGSIVQKGVANNQSIMVSDLNSGTYFLTIQNGENKSVHKFTKK
ncbi:MAG: hypothetical protein Kapaf2KO_21900 [Candidatus Kapaibacteriales bacterium]